MVLVSPYEHHSNELPWLESVAEVVEVALGADGRLDLADLDRKARAFAGRPLKVGAFSAASNVTGALTDVGAVARVLHAHGFLACADYAAAGPYVPIDMHPADPAERLDALFVSTHKFLGGSEGSGVLVAHRDLFRSRVPERPGGGTVDYVAAFERLSVDYTAAPRRARGGGHARHPRRPPRRAGLPGQGGGRAGADPGARPGARGAGRWSGCRATRA